VKLTFTAFSVTALLGALLLFLFVGYYPKFWAFMSNIFFTTYWVYALLFFAETFTVYLWYYGWNWLSGSRKWIHVCLGVLSNLFGTAILVVANSWATFMMSPAGIDDSARSRPGVGRHQQLRVDADQHPPADRQHRVRRHRSPAPTRRSGSSRPRRTRARALRLDGLYRNFVALSGVHRACRSPATTWAVRSMPSTRRWASR
jgi:hypothetical protein